MTGGKERVLNPAVSIVFLNYNRLDETRFTLGKLLQCKERLGSIEIVAVDNGSDDGTREFLLQHSDRINVVLLDRNIGIGGYNRGFEECSGEYFIVLDDDSHIEVETVKRVEDVFRSDRSIGVIAFKVVNADGKRFKTWHIPDEDRFQNSFAFVGCGFAIRGELFKDVGYYPEDFFLYHNEIEVAIKVRMKGFRVVFDPECVVVHRTEGTPRDPSRRIYFTLKNSLTIIWQYYPLLPAIYLTFSRLLISTALAVFHLKLNPLVKGVSDFLSSLRAREPLPHGVHRKELRPFFRHNSIIHRLLMIG